MGHGFGIGLLEFEGPPSKMQDAREELRNLPTVWVESGLSVGVSSKLADASSYMQILCISFENFHSKFETFHSLHP